MIPAKPSISVLVPVYNSANILPLLMERLEQTLLGLTSSYEIILINDGSHDNSWQVILQLAEERKSVKGIQLMRNYGQHNALLCGIRAANGEIIVTLDDDLQNPPEEIPKVLNALTEETDVVYGTPERQEHGLWRNVASQVTKLALKSAMGIKIAENVSSFRVFRTQLRGAFSNYGSPFLSIDVLLTWATTRFSSVPVRHEPRKSGESQYTFGKLVSHALNMMTGFSVVPLQLASIIGFVFTLFGIAVLFYVVGRYLISGGSVPGFPFLASVISIFSGAQLFALGIIGEYLSRMHFRMMERPTYSIRNQVNLND